ncbi:MAG: ZTL protein [Casimicrobium sp.]
MPACIYVLAGVNGAGKSSIGGALFAANNVDYFNPDLAAKTLLDTHPKLTQMEANARAWELGRRGLARALETGGTYAFETTLGANTIPDLLIKGATSGADIHIWFAGLATPELHIERVQARVAAGGHPIPEAKIRERYTSSRQNLIRLLPHLASLRVYDNSEDNDPKLGARPEPVFVLHWVNGRIEHAAQAVPQWAKAIVMAAVRAQA